MSFSDYKPVPQDPEEFLQYLVHRVMNTIGLKKIQDGRKSFEGSDFKDCYQELNKKDLVMPSMKEIKHCIKHKLVSDKDLVLYHLLIQMHLQLKQKDDHYECAKSFYKMISHA